MWPAYSTNQKKTNRERLTECIQFPFHTLFVSILYPFRFRSCTRSVSVPSLFANTFPVRYLLMGTAHSMCVHR